MSHDERSRHARQSPAHSHAKRSPGERPTGSEPDVPERSRTEMEHLTEVCPSASFKLHPGRVEGVLTLTSTAIAASFVHVKSSPPHVELFEACIATLGTCPRTFAGTIGASCEGDFATYCDCTIPIEVVSSYQGELVYESNRVAFAFEDTLSGRFCAADENLYLEAIVNSDFSIHPYYYILARR
jgi:hypothetical protein